MLGINLFNKAGATGQVFLVSGGKRVNKGIAYSGIIWPWETVAVVPTTPHFVDFSVNAQTKDKQDVTIPGNITLALSPDVAVLKYDFSVNPESGSYESVSPWQESLKVAVTERVRRVVLATAKALGVEEAKVSQSKLEEEVLKSLRQNSSAEDGFTVSSCSIPSVECGDEEVEDSIGAKEREDMIAEADKAKHDRRMKGSVNDRAVKKYETETVLKLEEDRAELVAKQGENEKAKAEADAEATRIRLAPLKDVESGKLIGAAIMDAAKSGRLGSLAITSEFLAAVGK